METMMGLFVGTLALHLIVSGGLTMPAGPFADARRVEPTAPTAVVTSEPPPPADRPPPDDATQAGETGETEQTRERSGTEVAETPPNHAWPEWAKLPTVRLMSWRDTGSDARFITWKSVERYMVSRLHRLRGETDCQSIAGSRLATANDILALWLEPPLSRVVLGTADASDLQAIRRGVAQAREQLDLAEATWTTRDCDPDTKTKWMAWTREQVRLIRTFADAFEALAVAEGRDTAVNATAPPADKPAVAVQNRMGAPTGRAEAPLNQTAASAEPADAPTNPTKASTERTETPSVRRAIGALSVLRENEDPAAAAAAALWMAQLSLSTPGDRHVLRDLPPTLREPNPSRMPYTFFARIKRCELISADDGHAAALALLMQLEDLCDQWFNTKQAPAARRTVVLAQLRVLAAWASDLDPDKAQAEITWCRRRFEHLVKTQFGDGEVDVLQLDRTMPGFMGSSEPAPTPPEPDEFDGGKLPAPPVEAEMPDGPGGRPVEDAGRR